MLTRTATPRWRRPRPQPSTSPSTSLAAPGSRRPWRATTAPWATSSTPAPTADGRTRTPDAEPIRTCAGCGRKAPQRELQRFHARDGELVAGAGPGRGVYTCRRLACFERAVSRRAFARTLHRTVHVDQELSRLYT